MMKKRRTIKRHEWLKWISADRADYWVMLRQTRARQRGVKPKHREQFAACFPSAAPPSVCEEQGA